jgi:DNA-directed RNA polymerase specialized sigma24 family protein
MRNQNLEDAIAELQEFIALRPEAREVRKALAVKLVYQGYLYEEIQTILDVSLGSISGWKMQYLAAVRQQLVILCQQMVATDAPLNSFKRKDWRISFILNA